MKRTICAFVALAGVAFVALSFDSSCANPDQLCRGTSINRRYVDEAKTVPEGECTRCVEAKCCDLIGDCQTTDCANQVATAHACVLDAGRSAPSEEPICKIALKEGQSNSVYDCMRAGCGEQCGLPTCHLEPNVPPLGDKACDQCFAKGCCSLMNECAKNRSCLLALRCIVDECGAELASELGGAALTAATARKDFLCDGGVPPPFREGDAGGNGGPSFDDVGGGCFRRCLDKVFIAKDPESSEAACLTARINECGAAVNCGRFCGPNDAAVDAPPSIDDAGSDAVADASDDGPSDAGAD